MKILIFHQYFRTPLSGGPIRSYYLAKALVERNHRVVVITTFNERLYKFENFEGIEVHYLPVPYDNRFGFYARTKSFLKYVLKAIGMARKFRDFDRCYAISVPLTVGMIVRWIKFRYRIPFIFEVGDLWPDAPIQMGYIKNPFFRWILYRHEKTIYRKADSVVALSPPIQKVIQEKVPGKLVHLIPNMSDTDFYKPEIKNPKTEEEWGISGKFVVAYIGALGVANGLEYVIACAEDAQMKGAQIHFIICGDGAMLKTLKTEVHQRNLGNLSILSFADRDGVKKILNVTDAVLVSYKNLPILETGSPNKFFDGLAAGKLIVVNFGGWIAQEIKEMGCGVQVGGDAKTKVDFVEKIQPFMQNPARLQQFQAAARLLAEKKYSRKYMSELYSNLFKG